MGREFIGAPIVDADGRLTTAVTSLVGTVASPLPADVAAVAGRGAASGSSAAGSELTVHDGDAGFGEDGDPLTRAGRRSDELSCASAALR